jgi:hypothetical protein
LRYRDARVSWMPRSRSVSSNSRPMPTCALSNAET